MHENFCVAGTFSAREVRKPNRKTNCSLMALQVSHLLCLSRLRVFRERAREKKRALACSRRSETAQRRQRLHGNFLFLQVQDRIGSKGRQFSRHWHHPPVRLFHLFRSVAAPSFLLLFFRGYVRVCMHANRREKLVSGLWRLHGQGTNAFADRPRILLLSGRRRAGRELSPYPSGRGGKAIHYLRSSQTGSILPDTPTFMFMIQLESG